MKNALMLLVVLMSCMVFSCDYGLEEPTIQPTQTGNSGEPVDPDCKGDCDD